MRIRRALAIVALVTLAAGCATVGSSSLPAGTIQAGSLANGKLISDAMVGVVAKVATLGCSKMDNYVPYVMEMPHGQVGARRWKEMWVVKGCGAEYPIVIDFNEAGPYAADWTIK